MAIRYHIMLMRSRSPSSVPRDSRVLLCPGKVPFQKRKYSEKKTGARTRQETGPQSAWEREVGGASGTTHCTGPAALPMALPGYTVVLHSSLALGMEV